LKSFSFLGPDSKPLLFFSRRTGVGTEASPPPLSPAQQQLGLEMAVVEAQVRFRGDRFLLPGDLKYREVRGAEG
jgi:hypothetical protein